MLDAVLNLYTLMNVHVRAFRASSTLSKLICSAAKGKASAN